VTNYLTPAKRLELAEKGKKYRDEHRDEKLRRDRQYRADNVQARREYDRGRAPAKNALRRGAAGSFTSADIEAQRSRQRERCFWCGKRLTESFHVDHVVPISRGGSNNPANLVISCPSCNWQKSAKHPMDFAGIMF
jgi:5-methylcytosine-specific restriction endonuclease McrA